MSVSCYLVILVVFLLQVHHALMCCWAPVETCKALAHSHTHPLSSFSFNKFNSIYVYICIYNYKWLSKVTNVLPAMCLLLLQGKSRSATAVITYIMACYQGKGVGFEEGLDIVRRERKMAEPNPAFAKILKDFEKSQSLSNLRVKLNV